MYAVKVDQKSELKSPALSVVMLLGIPCLGKKIDRIKSGTILLPLVYQYTTCFRDFPICESSKNSGTLCTITNLQKEIVLIDIRLVETTVNAPLETSIKDRLNSGVGPTTMTKTIPHPLDGLAVACGRGQ